jgi:hypothetical protein
MREMFGELFFAFPDIHVEVEDVIVDGNQAGVRWQATMTHLGDHRGMPATGKKVVLNSLEMFRMENGKAATIWFMIDSGSLARQLGLTPSPLMMKVIGGMIRLKRRVRGGGAAPAAQQDPEPQRADT